MGTEVRVYLWHDDPAAGNLAVTAVFDEIARIEALMSTYRDDSEISAVNRDAALRPVVVGPELYELIVRSLDISVLTRGAFDITYDSVGQYYDFRAGQRPDEATVQADLAKINYRLVNPNDSDHSIRFAAKGVRINLGGIAKGYAVDRGIRILTDAGIESAVVSAGGDSRILGNLGDRPRMIGIRHPRKEDQYVVVIPLEDTAISTSGDYERFFERDGVRFHHILDPETGDSARKVRSASVIAPLAIDTDALSTTVFVLGVEKGLALVNSLPGVDAIIVDGEGKLHYSQELLLSTTE